jgi:uncharacterized protein with FMN-binding domain
MEDDLNERKKKKLIATFTVLAVVAIMVLGIQAFSKPTAEVAGSETSDVASSQQSAADTGAADDSSGYKNGTYTATGSYNSPGGVQEVEVTLTLRDGAVTGSKVESGATDREAAEYQNEFIGGYKSFVTGKSIDDLNLSKISGSSLTPQGFNDAVEQIKDQAQA